MGPPPAPVMGATSRVHQRRCVDGSSGRPPRADRGVGLGRLTAVKMADLLGRRGVAVPVPPSSATGPKVCGRKRGQGPTVWVADGEAGGDLQVDFGRMGAVPDPAAGRNRVSYALIFTACESPAPTTPRRGLQALHGLPVRTVSTLMCPERPGEGGGAGHPRAEGPTAAGEARSLPRHPARARGPCPHRGHGPAEFLELVLADEVERRERTAADRRDRAAGLDRR